ncbi:MAG: hypothetical protein SH817_01345 [Leptospira sp.]|nr:hypothetical protein [Leptospira sp.]
MKFSILIFCFIFMQLFANTCKPTPESTFDELKKNASVFRQTIFCEENKSLLATREVECKQAYEKSVAEIENILNRQMDLVLTKVMVPKQIGEEIEALLRTKTELGIRYLEIWKQAVILE